MNRDAFAFLAGLLKERSGLVIGPDRLYLLEARLTAAMRARGIASLDALAEEIRTKRCERLIAEVVDAMTTNETTFFRDHTPFRRFREEVLPTFLAARAGSRRIRIWSAACSTGQEPYSIAMILREMAPALAGWSIDILGTDISERVLARARSGLYSTFEVQRGMPVQMLTRYFAQAGSDWKIGEEIQRAVRFQRCNLLGDISSLGNFDIVFCRNVLIYFDQPTKRRVLDAIAGRMAADGALLLGGAESVYGISDSFAEYPGLRGSYKPLPAGQRTGLFNKTAPAMLRTGTQP